MVQETTGHWRIHGGGGGRQGRAAAWVQFLSFSCSLRQTSSQTICFPPKLRGWRPCPPSPSGKSWIRHCWLVHQFTADLNGSSTHSFFTFDARMHKSEHRRLHEQEDATVTSKSSSILFWIRHWIGWGSSFPPGVGDPYVSLRYELQDIWPCTTLWGSFVG